MEKQEIIEMLEGTYCYGKLDLIARIERLKYGKLKRKCFYVTQEEHNFAVENYKGFYRVLGLDAPDITGKVYVVFSEGERIPLEIGIETFDYKDYLDEITQLADSIRGV